MSADDDRKHADQYADGDLLSILYREHADISDALDLVAGSKGDERASNLSAVTAFMKRHETAEQQVVRPIVSAEDAAEAEARDAEEAKADALIAELTALDITSAEFETKFATLKAAVAQHAELEETEEFPILEKTRSEAERVVLGEQFLRVRG